MRQLFAATSDVLLTVLRPHGRLHHCTCMPISFLTYFHRLPYS
jgi:hypothetical protein